MMEPPQPRARFRSLVVAAYLLTSAYLALHAYLLLRAYLMPGGGDLLTEPRPPPLVHLPQLGRVRGAWRGQGAAYLGIPYAEPPVRWQPAVPRRSWGIEVLDATSCPAAPCVTSNGVGVEDCLRVHVWTPPPHPSAQKVPVLVYVHGGAYANGNGCSDGGGRPGYGEALAALEGVVVVGLEYRLAVLGFLAHGGGGGEEQQRRGGTGGGTGGMLGAQDVLLALRWVRTNVGAFGGDATSVTLMGESAGASLAQSLLASPRASGLVHRAILLSPIKYGVPMSSEDAAAEHATLMARANATSLAALRRLPLAELMTLARGLRFTPSPDGDLLMEAPRSAWRRGAPAEHSLTALMIGYMTEDDYVGVRWRPQLPAAQATRQDLLVRLQRLMPAGVSPSDVLRHYPPDTYVDATGTPRAAYAAVNAVRDSGIACPVRAAARWAAAASVATFPFEFGSNWTGGSLPSGWFEAPGALGHSDEMNVVFGRNPSIPGADEWGDPAALLLATFGRSLWLPALNYIGSFVRGGVPVDAASGVAWPPLGSVTGGGGDDDDDAGRMYLAPPTPQFGRDRSGELSRPPTAEQCAFWDARFPYVEGCGVACTS